MPSQWADQPYSLISTEPFSKDVRVCHVAAMVLVSIHVIAELPRGILCRDPDGPRPQRHSSRIELHLHPIDAPAA